MRARAFGLFVGATLALSARAYAGDTAPASSAAAEPAALPAATTKAAPAPSAPVEVVVTGERPLRADRTQDASTVGGDALRRSARGSLVEALAQESGDVYVSARGGSLHGVSSGASGGVHIRGLGGSPNTQVLVVEDGVPDYQGIFGHPLPDAYVPALLDRAVVLKGGDSVLYGSNAMGGVILLRSRFRREEGWELENDAAFGSYMTMRETASLLFKRGPLDLAGSVHLLRTDGHRPGTGGSTFVGQVAARVALGQGWSVTLRDRVVHLDGADPGPASHPYADHGFDVWRNTTSLHAELAQPGLRLRLVPHASVGLHRLYDGLAFRDVTAGMTAEVTLPLSRRAELVAGATASWLTATLEQRLEGRLLPTRGTSDYAVYSQLTLRPHDRVTLTAGTRELISNTYGPVLLGKAGLRWDLWGGLHLRTRVATGFRQPTLRELYLPFPVANPSLRPERSLTWDIGLGYDHPHVQLGLTGYRTQATDLIKYFGTWPTVEVVNIDRVVVWGFEGHVAARRLGPVNLAVTGSFQDVGTYTKQNPQAKLNATVEVAHAFGAHTVGGTVSAEWVHGLFMENYGRRPIPDVFVMDLAIRYRYEKPERALYWEPYLLVRNLLDRRYAYLEDYPMPGLNLLAGLRIGT